MRLDRPFVRLAYRFDARRLQDEVAALPSEAWRRHPTGHKGNTAVPLMSVGGELTDDSIAGAHAPTPWLIRSPYLSQVVAAFGVPVGRTRLMRIEAGGHATAHYDAHLYWKNRVRIHVPIITNPAVVFVSGGARTHMVEGEAWVFDTLRVHDVLNDSDEARVHLVIDTVGTPQLWDQIRSGGNSPPVDVDFEPGRTVVILPEQYNLPDVMSPGDLSAILADLRQLAPDDGSADAILDACGRFISGWTALWAIEGPAVAPSYRTELDRFAAELADLPDARIPYNGASLRALANSWLVDPAIASGSRPAPAPPVRVREHAGGSPDIAADRDERFDRPLVIVSPPRAGSTLLFETLSRSPDLFTVGGESHRLIESIPELHPASRGWDSNVLTSADATPAVKQRLRDAFFQHLVDRHGSPPPVNGRSLRMLEKTPKNALRIAFLDALFPEARYVYLHREPRGEISSLIDGWRSGRFVTYRDLPGWTGLPWSFVLTPGWRELIGAALQHVCAAQWKSVTEAILDDLDAVAPGRWIAVDYERLVADPVGEVAKVCRFAEVRWEDDLRDGLPLARHTLTPPDPNKWRLNATELHEVLPATEPTEARARSVLGQSAARPTQPAGKPTPSNLMASVHTTTVPELLARTGSSVVVTTYQGGRLITLRAIDGVLNTHFTAVPRPMGIAASGDGRLSVGSTNEIWTYRNQPAVAAKIEPAGLYGSAYVLRNRHVTGNVSVHELRYAADGELWLVATGFSCLATIDADHSFVPRWRPPFVTALAAEDRCHLNGVGFRDGRPRYVTAFADSDQPQGWRDARTFGGLVIDVDSGDVITRRLCMPHSPRWYRDQLWVLESGRGSLNRIDLATGRTEVVALLPGFTRGLEFIGRYALVGLSQVRESVFAGIPLTAGNDQRHSGIWIVDLETGSIAGFVRFDGIVQEIFDLVVLNGPGLAHVVDIEGEQHGRSFVLPEAALRDVPA